MRRTLALLLAVSFVSFVSSCMDASGAGSAHPAARAPDAAPDRGTGAQPAATLDSLAAAAPDIDRKVLSLALDAMACALQHGDIKRAPARLAVIDYALPSTRPRLWVFDLAASRVLFTEPVAHGRGSGEDMATRFSNDEGSQQSSLGLFRTSETYTGENGYSLRMDGLEPGFNDHARDRLIVMHGAPYVDLAQAKRQGRLGRSWGCPAVRSAIAVPLIDSLKDGQLLFAYANDPAWLQDSPVLHCPPARAGKPPSR